MIRLITFAAFALAVAMSAQAMTLTPLHQAAIMIGLVLLIPQRAGSHPKPSPERA